MAGPEILLVANPSDLGLTHHQRRIIEYFSESEADYRRLWGTNRHLGLHCGFHDREHRRHDDAVIHMNRVLASLASITAEDRVLDAGCGIGGSALWLAQDKGCRLVGVNIHPQQVQQARQLAEARGLADGVEFQLADFCATGLPDESFDVVWALESVCYAERKERFLAEAYRLLKRGGRLIVADGFLTHCPLRPDEERIVQAWCEGWFIPNVVSVHCFADWLQEAGFGNIRFRDITTQVTPSSRRIYFGSLCCYPIRVLLHWLGLCSAIRMRGIASGFYQYQACRRGIGIYGVFLAEK